MWVLRNTLLPRYKALILANIVMVRSARVSLQAYIVAMQVSIVVMQTTSAARDAYITQMVDSSVAL